VTSQPTSFFALATSTHTDGRAVYHNTEIGRRWKRMDGEVEADITRDRLVRRMNP
jgi:hypothetical protein